MRTSFSVCALLALLPLSSSHVAAQVGTGELWEISTQMNIPGMPAGMGGQTQRICGGDDPERAAAQKKDRSCKVTDKKQTANRLTVTMVCTEGTMTVDQQYNAARTEFKGTMKMTSKDGDMTMNMSGRKVGGCDVQEAKREREEKSAAIKKRMDDGAAASAAAIKQQSDMHIKNCNAAVETMEYGRLGNQVGCYKKGGKDCQAFAQAYPEAQKACSARAAEFCTRYQTQDGFVKAKGDEEAAKMCGVSTAAIKAAQCPRAAQGGSLAFLGAYCPVEAKPLAQEHCAGRDYTSKMGGKYATFCAGYLANADFEKTGRKPAAASGQAQPKPAPTQAQQPAPAPAPTQGEQTADQVKEGISQGLDKLKGLFGR
jgi:hypothetical protein